MKNNALNDEWKQLLENVYFTKNLLSALGLLIFYILYINKQILSYQALLTIISYLFVANFILKKQTSKCYYYINKIWHKGLTDYRYARCLEELYSTFNNLEPYAMKVWSEKDGYQIIPYSLYKSKSKSIF